MKDYSKEECDYEIRRFNEEFWRHWIVCQGSSLPPERQALASLNVAILTSIRLEYASNAITFLERSYNVVSKKLAEFVSKKKREVDSIYAREIKSVVSEVVEEAIIDAEKRLKEERLRFASSKKFTPRKTNVQKRTQRA